MGWTSEEEEINIKRDKKKNSMETSTKLLIGIILCVLIIIILIIILLNNINSSTYKVFLDGKGLNIEKNQFVAEIEEKEYINISEFSKLVGYEYHNGEYKSYTIEENCCYVENKNETATFYLNENKVCKSPMDDLTSEYQEFKTENVIKEKNGQLYATKDAIELAFNVSIDENEKSTNIYTLNYMVSLFNEKVQKWGYASIEDLNFENQKAIRYGYIIVQKEKELYKIIDGKNNEIVTAKYSNIQFSEVTEEFFVTNSSNKVGIIKKDGTTKIDPIYDSISLIDNNLELYLVEKDNKFGVVKNGNKTIVPIEYDKIGINNSTYTDVKNGYLLLETLIPVCKNNKWGAYDTKGNLILKIEYDKLGCDLSVVKVQEKSKNVDKVLVIEECEGIVVGLDKKYGVMSIEGKELVPIAVDSIYSITTDDKEKTYYMIYNDNELNIIERLEKAGLIKEKTSEIVEQPSEDNITVEVSNTTISNTTNNIENKVSDN